MPRAKASAGPASRTGGVVEDDAALVGLVDALQDAHQRRLARAVAADDRVDRARRDGEIDAVVGDDRAKSARHVARAPMRTATRAAHAHLKKSG